MSAALPYRTLAMALCATACLYLSVAAQGPMVRNYTLADGLPSNTIYCMEVDELGFLWIGTSEGIARFDGTRFESYGVDDGLRDNSVLRMKRDSKGRIWYSTDNGSYGYILKGKIHHGWDHPILRNHPLNSFIYDLASDPSGKVWLATEKDGIWVWNDTSMVQAYPPGYIFSCINYHEGEVVAFTDSRNKGVSAILRFDPLAGCMISCLQFDFPLEELYDMPRSNFYHLGNGLLSGNAQGGVFSLTHINSIEDGNIIEELNGFGVSLSSRHYGEDYYVLYQGSGFVRFQLDEKFNVKGAIEQHLSGTIVSSMLMDSSENLWVSTLDQGLMLYQPRSVITPLNGQQQTLATINMSRVLDDTLFFSDANGNLFMMEGEEPRLLMNVKLRPGSVFDFIQVKDGLVVNLITTGFIYLPKLPEKAISLNLDSLSYILAFRHVEESSTSHSSVFFPKENAYYFPSPTVKSMMMMGNDTLMAGTTKGLRLFPLFKNGQLATTPVPLSVGRDIRVINTHKDATGRYWVIYTDGLYEYRGGSLYPQQELNQHFLKVKMTQCLSLPDSSLLLATASMGLIHYFPDTHKWESFSKLNSPVGNRIHHVLKDSESTFFVASSSGIAVLSYDGQNGKTFFSEFRNIQLSHLGFPRRLSKSSENLYLQSSNGLYSLPLDLSQERPRTFPIYITHATANASTLPVEGPHELKHDQSNFRFQFVGLDFSSVGRLTYEFRLLSAGGDTSWLTTSINEVNYNSLAPNTYTFQVRAVAFDGLPSINTAEFGFVILPPWYRTWWFRVLAILAVLAAGSLLFMQRLRTVRRRNKMELRLLESEQKALRSQMNPHFIFNSLNSIQRFLATNNPNESIRYLTKFGRLMRSILDHSRESAIPIGEELNALRLYLELESLRTGHKFDFEIHLDPKLDELGVRMPPLLLQPYVENAIWHGIMPKEGRGVITISLQDSGTSIRCSVQDNGIGRAKAQELKGANPTRRKSHGMNITAERLALLNRDKPRAITVRITDLYADNGAATGTRVEMDIPKEF